MVGAVATVDSGASGGATRTAVVTGTVATGGTVLLGGTVCSDWGAVVVVDAIRREDSSDLSASTESGVGFLSNVQEPTRRSSSNTAEAPPRTSRRERRAWRSSATRTAAAPVSTPGSANPCSKIRCCSADEALGSSSSLTSLAKELMSASL